MSAPTDLARLRLAAAKARRAAAIGRYCDLVLAGVLDGPARQEAAQQLIELGQAEQRARMLAERRHARPPTAARPSVKPAPGQVLRLVSSLPDPATGEAARAVSPAFSGRVARAGQPSRWSALPGLSVSVGRRRCGRGVIGLVLHMLSTPLRRRSG